VQRSRGSGPTAVAVHPSTRLRALETNDSAAAPRRERAMDANFDADLEQLEDGHCTAQPHDEVQVLVFREREMDDAVDELFD
jgi:hypothetical protein